MEAAPSNSEYCVCTCKCENFIDYTVLTVDIEVKTCSRLQAQCFLNIDIIFKKNET